MALNCLFAALYAALSILLGCAAVFAGQVLVKHPSVSFCKFPARAGQPPPPPAGRLAPAIAGSPLLSTKTAPAGYPRQGLLYVSYGGGKPACIRPSGTPAERHGPSLNTGGRRL